MLVLDDAVAVLTRTPDVVRSLLEGLPDEWTAFRAEATSWSPYDVLGHLIHGERTDWIPRLRVILEYGATRPFAPFDRAGMRDNTDDLSVLLDTFAGLRAQSLRDLADARLTHSDLDRTGMHPDLGEVTLASLVASWAVHDLSHVAQITETMAKRYRADIGPWRAYLPIVDRAELPD
ncbi:MAG TPA: DinB family protein [Mycobacteriales bacterium]|nr:DinB family protein [Mycobacteriales bacterium]